MGIQQNALFLTEGGKLRMQGEVKPLVISLDSPFCQALQELGRPASASQLPEGTLPEEITWGKLFAPLLHEKRLHGLLVLGSRVTGDLYHAYDVRIITTVSQQAALAYAKVRVVERHRGLARRLVQMDEIRRKVAARDLHDTVLQVLLLIKGRLVSDLQQGELAALQDDAIQHLRRIIKVQRPSLLDRSLELALQDLVKDMQVLVGATPKISWYSDLPPLTSQVNEEKATAVYRITQEALSNALRHAQAETVVVKLEQKENGNLILVVQDNGVGIALDARKEPYQFGLEGMRERALMIGADLHISSYPGAGTTVMLGFAP